MRQVPESNIINCFRKAGISKESQCDAEQDIDDPFKHLSDSLKELITLDPSLAPGDITGEFFVDADKKVSTTTKFLPNYEEICVPV